MDKSLSNGYLLFEIVESFISINRWIRNYKFPGGRVRRLTRKKIKTFQRFRFEVTSNRKVKRNFNLYYLIFVCLSRNGKDQILQYFETKS